MDCKQHRPVLAVKGTAKGRERKRRGRSSEEPRTHGKPGARGSEAQKKDGTQKRSSFFSQVLLLLRPSSPGPARGSLEGRGWRDQALGAQRGRTVVEKSFRQPCGFHEQRANWLNPCLSQASLGGQIVGKETREPLGEMSARWPRASKCPLRCPGACKARRRDRGLWPGKKQRLPHLRVPACHAAPGTPWALT